LDGKEMNPNENAMLKRKLAAAALTEAGFETSPATLATKATRGGGPPYEKWGRTPLYRWGPTLAWARARLRAPVRSTPEASAQEGAGARRVKTREPKCDTDALVDACAR
jgi:hypothetical protein